MKQGFHNRVVSFFRFSNKNWVNNQKHNNIRQNPPESFIGTKVVVGDVLEGNNRHAYDETRKRGFLG